MDREQRGDQFIEVEDLYANYEVYDNAREKLGKVDDLFVDENDQPEYIGVKTGLFGLRSTLIPWEMVRVDEQQRRIEVLESKYRVKDAPNFDEDKDITPEFEREVYSHFGLRREESTGERGRYGAYYDAVGGHHSPYGAATDEASGERHPGIAMGDADRERGEFREHELAAEGITEPKDDLREEDELRVQRSEEELRAGTREREAGGVGVRKRVRTEREQLRVPKRREEVHVERVPVEEGRQASEAEIGEEEVQMPVTEEEVVVEKQPVVKEEIRVSKDVVQDEEVVEEDVRREEVDVDDETRRRDR
ncbi:MAG: DUF2382 domain-containing protein [Rubrobacter sp.]|nr:DUF2382 domain-containing protein [Rubrobacter sp.]